MSDVFGHDYRSAARDTSRALILLLLALGSRVPDAEAEASVEAIDDGKEVDPITEIIVTSRRRPEPLLDHAGNIARLDEDVIRAVNHQHIYELMTRVPGTWVSRGSGQEHLTAIRSPVLTGAGSCGAFLMLEDGIPMRPAGFCNVNQLFELYTEEARAIEVIRGPGNALYGSNALHGTINAIMPSVYDREPGGAAIEAGANDFLRATLDVPFDPSANFLAVATLARDGGFREDTGYEQGKAHFKAAVDGAPGELEIGLTLTELDQETAGFIEGEDAYEDPNLNRSNANPEAFRDASSQRLYGLWSVPLGDTIMDLRPFVRHSDMSFLQHFLPGQPLEENGHTSAGLLGAFTRAGERHSTVYGFDLEWTDSWLREFQENPTEGSEFLVETRPQGLHYDYDVQSVNLAAYVQSEIELSPAVSGGGGIRIEYVNYDYTNKMLDGNTRDDGTPCGFGGCLYTRPADRTDDFTLVAPKLFLTWHLTPQTVSWVNLATGFRPPQMTELYRLQSGQSVADLDPERISSAEVGIRFRRNTWSADVAAFWMDKKDSVYRDSAGFNVSGARTRHLGVEGQLDWQIAADWLLVANASFARHTYEFDRVAAQGETFVSGRDVDTAPEWLANAELEYRMTDDFDLALQLVFIDEYYLDAENRFRYPGHTLLNLRVAWQIDRQLSAIVRVNNLADEAYADRADYAFGDYRYFPGRGREAFFELVWSAAP